MIFHWLKQLYRALARLVFPPPGWMTARVTEDEPCPVCGNRKGRLRCVEVCPSRQSNNQPAITVLQRTCRTCGARRYIKPLAKVDPSLISPAIARDPIEEREDSQRLLADNTPERNA